MRNESPELLLLLLLLLSRFSRVRLCVGKGICFKTVFQWNLFFSFRLLTNLPLTKDSEDKANSGFCLFMCS